MPASRRSFIAALGAGLSFPWKAQGAETSVVKVVEALEGGQNYLSAKLAFDAFIDAASAQDSIVSEINSLTEAARKLAGSTPDDRLSLSAVRKVIYDAGPWNDGRPFAYDLSDPLGRNIRNTLLATYLKTRRGNCVSMPTLFLIMADRLGVNVALATAPEHMFIQYTAPDGKVFNIEATSGAHAARDEWYRQNMPMTDAAITNGIYMRSLTKREAIAAEASTVVTYLMHQGRYHEAIAVCEAILEAAPKDAVAMVAEGSSYGRLIETEFQAVYATPALIPPELRARYSLYVSKNQSLIENAEALGWRAPSAS
jgi:regulator of sirC expression with transglutaminase-like and TPR domain